MSDERKTPSFPEAKDSKLEIRAPSTHRSPLSSGREHLNQLLSERNRKSRNSSEIDEQIRKAFERTVAILALDMCDFTRLTIKHGIIHYLAMIHQMVEVATPAITDNGGTVIKQEADDIFAAFDNPTQALEAALDIFRALDAVNSVVAADLQIFASIGIGFGDTLVIGDEDMFGSEMNLACKLGEDIAKKSEILITPAAFSALPAGRYQCEPVKILIEGLEITCYRYERTIHHKEPEAQA